MRIVTAVLGMPLALSLTYFGGIYWLVAITILGLISLTELSLIFRGRNFGFLASFAYVGLLLLTVFTYYLSEDGLLFAVVLTLLLAGSLLVFRFDQIDVSNIIAGFFALCYVGLPLSYLILLRKMSIGFEAVILTLILTWSNDTGAFFIGKFFGKRPLAERVSPKKTWEGSLGGVFLTILVAVGLSAWLHWATHAIFALLGLCVAVAGQVGDLAESALKRWAGVKDSGRLLPGHGGMLDRFDSILFIAPIVYYFLKTIVLQ